MSGTRRGSLLSGGKYRIYHREGGKNHDKRGSILVHASTKNAEKLGTTVIVKKNRQLVGTFKQTRGEQIIMSGILPVMESTGKFYRNCRTMASSVAMYGRGRWISGDAFLGGLI